MGTKGLKAFNVNVLEILQVRVEIFHQTLSYFFELKREKHRLF